jgi:hypothetical protein
MKYQLEDVRINRSLHWIGTKLYDPPRYDGLTEIDMFIKSFELQVPEQQRLLALDVILKETPTRWWVMHRKGMKDWAQCSRLMQICFGPEEAKGVHKYIGEGDLVSHINRCRDLWCSESETEWPHRFIHTLDTIPRNWYLELEMHRETTEWQGLVQRFEITFSFEHESPSIHAITTGHPNKDLLEGRIDGRRTLRQCAQSQINGPEAIGML